MEEIKEITKIDHYINGTVEYKLIGELKNKLSANKKGQIVSIGVWDWWSSGTQPVKGVPIRYRKCRGIIKCYGPDCTITMSVPYDTKRLENKLLKKCMCGGDFYAVKCNARASIAMHKDGVVILKHEGTHEHPHPENPRFLPQDRKEYLKLRQENPDYEARHLQKIATEKISPAFINLSKTEKLHREVENEIRTMPHQTVLTQSGQLRAEIDRECPGFIKLFVLENDSHVIVMQSQHMKKIIEERLLFKDLPVNSIVTDAAHKFFADGYLVTSVVWCHFTMQWTPILHTYMSKVSTSLNNTADK